jgi:hypothetical protein
MWDEIRDSSLEWKCSAYSVLLLARLVLLLCSVTALVVTMAAAMGRDDTGVLASRVTQEFQGNRKKMRR